MARVSLFQKQGPHKLFLDKIEVRTIELSHF